MDIHQFANGTPEQRNDLFQKTGMQLDMDASIIEKDFWVCWSLKQLFGLPTFGNHMIFKGGTSLSKVYNAIFRFSEDVDISLDRKLLGFEGEYDPGNPSLSGNKQQKLLRELQIAAEAAVAGILMTETRNTFALNLKQDFH